MRDQDVVAKATAALEESVASILDCDEDDVVKRDALAESFSQFQSYLARNVTGSNDRARREKFEKIFSKAADDDGDDVVKAARDRYVGHRSLASAVVEHALDRLDHLRRKHGFEKAHTATKDHTMNRTEELRAIAKDYGVHRLCKLLVDEGESHGIDEGELVELISNHDRRGGETAAKCFARQYEANTDDGLVLRKAIQIAKAAAFQVFYGPSMQPAQISGSDINPDNVNEALRKLAEIGAKKWPHEKPDVQFSRAFESEPVLARAAHVRPTAPAGGAYEFPR
jgi:hypothetical protein